MKRVIIYANLTYDVVGGERRPGGPGLYAAYAASFFGYSVRVYGAVGRDGHEAIAEYMRRGIRFEKLVFNIDEETTRFRIIYEGNERKMMVEALGPTVYSVEAREPRILAPVLREFPIHHMRQLADRAYLDVQGLVRARRIGPLNLDPELCNRILAESKPKAIHGDIRELLVCLKAKPAELPARLLDVSKKGAEVLASMGYRGLLLFNDGRVYRVSAWGPKASDPTGMGDILLASYAMGREESLDSLEAVRRAVVVCGFRAEGKKPGSDDPSRYASRVEVRELTLEEAREAIQQALSG